MKVLIVALTLVACVAADWVPKTLDEFKTIRAECIVANPLSDEYLEKINEFVYVDVEPVRKYILCTAKKMGVFCEHEGYHVDRVVKQFKKDVNADEAEAIAIAEKCRDNNEQNSSADAWVFRGHVCLLNSKLGDALKAVAKNHKAAAKA